MTLHLQHKLWTLNYNIDCTHAHVYKKITINLNQAKNNFLRSLQRLDATLRGSSITSPEDAGRSECVNH